MLSEISLLHFFYFFPYSLLLQTTASEKALVEEREVVYEQANSATYSSFKKRDKVDRWTTKGDDIMQFFTQTSVAGVWFGCWVTAVSA